MTHTIDNRWSFNNIFRLIFRHAAARMFNAAGIPTSLVLDCAVGAAMEIADLCIVGAEGVMENGGIVNKVIRNHMQD
jgi:hypothetical protein